MKSCGYFDFLIKCLFEGDFIVGKEQIDEGHTWWGFWIVTLMFAPNLVFMTWFILAHRKTILNKDTWYKVFIAGNVQFVTLVK